MELLLLLGLLRRGLLGLRRRLGRLLCRLGRRRGRPGLLGGFLDGLRVWRFFLFLGRLMLL